MLSPKRQNPTHDDPRGRGSSPLGTPGMDQADRGGMNSVGSFPKRLWLQSGELLGLGSLPYLAQS